MIILGTLGVSAIIVVALVLAGILLYSGWRAVRDELAARNFRSQPPHVGSIGLTLLGVILPVVMLTLFLAALAASLFGLLLA